MVLKILSMKSLPLLTALTLFLCIFQTGCVVGRRTVSLPIPSAGAPVPSKGSVYLESVTDARTFQNKPPAPSTPSVDGDVTALSAEQKSVFIGRQRNGYGKAMGDIALPAGETVQKRMTALFEEALRRRGYSLASDPSAPTTANIVIDEFWAWFTPGFLAVTFESRVTCKFSLKTAGGAQAFLVTGHGNNVGQVASDANWQLAYQRAFEDFLTQLDRELEKVKL